MAGAVVATRSGWGGRGKAAAGQSTCKGVAEKTPVHILAPIRRSLLAGVGVLSWQRALQPRVSSPQNLLLRTMSHPPVGGRGRLLRYARAKGHVSAPGGGNSSRLVAEPEP